MKNITNRGRKTLSRFFSVISVAAALLLLQACDILFPGEPLPSIQGKVRAKKTSAPIPGIKVFIGEIGYLEYTDKDGAFKFEEVPINGDYKITLEDVDGQDNGGLFKGKTLTLEKNEYNTNLRSAFLLIDLDLDTSAQGQ